MGNIWETTLGPVGPVPLQADDVGRELKRGALLNTVAMVTANFRAVFTILVARLLGPVALGIFSVAWATTDLISKFGILGLDDAVITFVAQANASADRARCRGYFHAAILIGVVQSSVIALVAAFLLPVIGQLLRLQPEMISATQVIVCALPGIALYRISTSVSRGIKVMEHDIFSRGFTESGVTTLAFLMAFVVGSRVFAPEIGAVVGSTASGLVAFALAQNVFARASTSNHVAFRDDAWSLLRYSLPIGADQLLNAFIWRIDLILLGLLVNRAPGVTLVSLGIYGAVVGIANGLRKISQAFIPIFAPVVAGMTATGEHTRARETYAKLAQWMLWILLPFVAVLALAGNVILLIFGHAFQNGSAWLTVVALACATNAFISLGETVIMVQRPRLNLLNSLVTSFLGTAVTFILILRLGVTGAALGMLITYLVQGVVRNIILRFVFNWRSSWTSISEPFFAAFVAMVPALAVRLIWRSRPTEGISGSVFLALFALLWQRHRRRATVSVP